MKQYLYIYLLIIPVASHAMEKVKGKVPEPIVIDLKREGSSSSDITTPRGAQGSRGWSEILGFLKKKSSKKESSGSLDMHAIDTVSNSNDSLPTPCSPRTPKEPFSPANARVTRSSDGTMSPRSVSFDSVVQGRTDDNKQAYYEMDGEGRLSRINTDDEDAQSATTSPAIKYLVDPEGRKNPHYKNPKIPTLRSPDAIPNYVKAIVLATEGQCPVGVPQVPLSPTDIERNKNRPQAQIAAALYSVAIAEQEEEQQYYIESDGTFNAMKDGLKHKPKSSKKIVAVRKVDDDDDNDDEPFD